MIPSLFYNGNTNIMYSFCVTSSFSTLNCSNPQFPKNCNHESLSIGQPANNAL